MEKGQYPLLFLLHFVRCGVSCCGAVAPRVTAALLGRFLPRLGPLAFAGGPFFLRAFNIADASLMREIRYLRSRRITRRQRGRAAAPATGSRPGNRPAP